MRYRSAFRHTLRSTIGARRARRALISTRMLHSASRVQPVRSTVLSLFVLLAGGACDRPLAAGDGLVDADAVPRLVAREELRIGSANDPDSGFTRIGPVELDADGNVYVVESSEREILVFDTGGRRIRTIGRAGDGPGEFRFPNRMGVVGDTLWVGEDLARRVTLFSREGRVHRTIRAGSHPHTGSDGRASRSSV